MTDNKFDDIRPYRNDEIHAAMQRIADSETFPLLSSFVFPDEDIETVRRRVRSYHSIDDFQFGVMWHVNNQIVKRSTTGLTYEGLDKLDPNKCYMFVSNHRDIMLDSSLMQNILHDNGFHTTEITFGANLMQGELVIDIGKSNKMFRVERPGGSVREFYQKSLHLSEYMRHAITKKHESVWIAQRNGRTKDGIDRTDQGIIKMFGMSRTDDKVKSLAELNIVPVCVSYEWESCDILKTLELYATRLGPYIKKPGEDLNSILTGIVQPKGHVHIHFCDVVTEADLMQFDSCTSSDFNRNVATLLDQRICSNYQLSPNNYIAHDMLHRNQKFIDRYTIDQKQQFLDYMQQFRKYENDCDIEQLVEIFLGIYANPVDSYNEFSKLH